MRKSAEAFRSIGEVAKLIGVAPHVLRYWETQFSQLKPMKRPDGRRYYRPDDVRLAAGLCEILRDEGLTIRGAKKMLARDRGESVRARGAQRLADAMGVPEPDAAEPSSDAPDVRTETHVASSAEKTAPFQSPAESQKPAFVSRPALDVEDPDPTPDEEMQDMAVHSPRSRHRRRRHGSTDGALPLFPELDHTTSSTVWLARLTGLSAALRDLPDTAPQARRARPQLAALRDAITALY